MPRHFRLCCTAAGAASTAQLGELQLLLLLVVVDRWIVSLTIAVVLLLVVL